MPNIDVNVWHTKATLLLPTFVACALNAQQSWLFSSTCCVLLSCLAL